MGIAADSDLAALRNLDVHDRRQRFAQRLGLQGNNKKRAGMMKLSSSIQTHVTPDQCRLAGRVGWCRGLRSAAVPAR